MLDKVKKLFDSPESTYNIAKQSGVPINTVRRLRTGEATLENGTYKNIKLLHDYQIKKEMDIMAKVLYEDIEVGTVVTNQSLTVEEALELIGFDEEKFCEEQGFDVDEGLDPEEFRMEY